MSEFRLPEGALDGYRMLQELRHEIKVLESKKEAITRYLKMRVKDAPEDGVFFKEWDKTIIPYKQVLDSLKAEHPDIAGWVDHAIAEHTRTQPQSGVYLEDAPIGGE